MQFIKVHIRARIFSTFGRVSFLRPIFLWLTTRKARTKKKKKDGKLFEGMKNLIGGVRERKFWKERKSEGGAPHSPWVICHLGKVQLRGRKDEHSFGRSHKATGTKMGPPRMRISGQHHGVSVRSTKGLPTPSKAWLQEPNSVKTRFSEPLMDTADSLLLSLLPEGKQFLCGLRWQHPDFQMFSMIFTHTV